MIKFEQVVPMLEETKIPVISYGELIGDDEYELPLIVWNYTSDEPFTADGIPYVTMYNISMTVLTEEMSRQKDVKDILHDHEVYYTYSTDFDESNHVYIGTYSFQTL